MSTDYCCGSPSLSAGVCTQRAARVYYYRERWKERRICLNGHRLHRCTIAAYVRVCAPEYVSIIDAFARQLHCMPATSAMHICVSADYKNTACTNQPSIIFCVLFGYVRGDLTVVRVHNQNALLYSRREGRIKSSVSHFVVNEEIKREIS